LDVKKKLFGGYEVMIHNGKKSTGKKPIDLVTQFNKLGAREIVINSIDRNGTMSGYDKELIEKARKVTSLPLTVLGGAGTLGDIGEMIKKFGVIGASAGSLFVFRGKYKAVLISYHEPDVKKALLSKYLLFQ